MRHKTALTMATSVVGVMLAGSAVLAANMGILTESAGLGSLDPEATTSTTIEVVDSTTIPGELIAYQVDGVGVVYLLRNDTVLSVDSVEVSDSWTWELKEDPEHPGGIVLIFTSVDQTIEFTVWVEDGQVMVTVEEAADESAGQDDHGEDESSEDEESDDD